MLRIVRAVEINTLGVLARTSVVTSNDEVCGSVILADDSVPNGFAGTGHAHSKGQQTDDSHAIGITGQESLVYTDTGEVVDVAGFRKTDDGVDEDVGLAGAGGADSEFTMGAVHRVPTKLSLGLL